MIVTTTPNIEGKQIIEYRGVVSGETIMGANILKDFLAGIRDVIGGRSGAYEQSLRQAREAALQEMIRSARELGANAIVGVDLDYESINMSSGGNMLMVSATGTAVKYK